MALLVRSRRGGRCLSGMLAALLMLAIIPASSPANTFTDVLGFEVRWERPPQRIVSLSPSLTEILFAIGGDSETIVGITGYCNYPAETASIQKVGGIVDPSLEAILMVRPDLVLATRGNPLEFLESLRRLSVPVYGIEANGDLELIVDVIREVGAITGLGRRADSLATSLTARLAAVRERTATLSAAQRPRVYFGELDGAHWTPGPGSYVHGLLTAAGCENVGAVATAPWSPLSLEVIIEQDPQVLIGTYTDDDEANAREKVLTILGNQTVWRQSSLGREPTIVMIHADRILRPGPRVFDVLEEITATLHPQLSKPEWRAGDKGELR